MDHGLRAPDVLYGIAPGQFERMPVRRQVPAQPLPDESGCPSDLDLHLHTHTPVMPVRRVPVQ
jgi:hypothetical protein